MSVCECVCVRVSGEQGEQNIASDRPDRAPQQKGTDHHLSAANIEISLSSSSSGLVSKMSSMCGSKII